jgi:hypothetical protein
MDGQKERELREYYIRLGTVLSKLSPEDIEKLMAFALTLSAQQNQRESDDFLLKEKK